MKVGTDAVLLGAWTQPEHATSILDIGTGTGIIAIMLAQKSSANIDAIEIDADACIQAKENSQHSPWADKIHIHHESLQRYTAKAGRTYDLIVSNPPYFIDASKPSETARLAARHTDYNLSFNELIDGVLSLLSPDGRFCVILPNTEGQLFMDKAIRKDLFCNKLARVKTKPSKTEKRFMMEFSRKESTTQEAILVIQEEDTRYTQAYVELTKDYYLGLKEFRNEP